jgi:hypothetical protein
MRPALPLILSLTMLSACAHAQTRAPIPDTEPDVTRQVHSLLSQATQGALAPEQFTDNARGALADPQLAATTSLLQKCATVTDLELLERTTKGEDRQYLYRARCASTALLVAIDFNKAAKVNRFSINEEKAR